ncbi:MAG: hypothetical protein O6849_03150 [Candidatus Dadabacteria bacterium]|jgi:hypothetical protein|nr:hypothetical protein [Candidatus Dadabacteria bacterium]MCZ6555854.1 hypothetical protein [Candidatus Dadabacteria bacterium]MCZ6684968.1 hypothetical protein [Candidatus Dadabacteria bacterium]
MAEVTINIPDPILAIIQKRADMTKSTPEQLIATTAIICYAAAHYDSSKWLKSRDPMSEDMTASWT